MMTPKYIYRALDPTVHSQAKTNPKNRQEPRLNGVREIHPSHIHAITFPHVQWWSPEWRKWLDSMGILMECTK